MRYGPAASYTSAPAACSGAATDLLQSVYEDAPERCKLDKVGRPPWCEHIQVLVSAWKVPAEREVERLGQAVDGSWSLSCVLSVERAIAFSIAAIRLGV